MLVANRKSWHDSSCRRSHLRERSFIQAVSEDFKELEEAGITHPDMDKIKALLTTHPDSR